MTKTQAPKTRDFTPIVAVLIAIGLGFFASAFYYLPPLAEVIQNLSSPS